MHRLHGLDEVMTMKAPETVKTLAPLGLSVLVVALLGSACAGPGDDPRTRAAAPPPVAAGPKAASVQTSPLARPDTAGRVVYDAGLVSDPVPAGSPRVAVSATRALAVAAEQQQFGPDLQPGTPTATLRMVTVGSAGDEPAPTARASWVLTWTGSAAAVRGPVTLSDQDRARIRAATRCVFVVVVDATSAKAVDARQLCSATG